MKKIKEFIEANKTLSGGGNNTSFNIDKNSIKYYHHVVDNPIIDQELIKHIDPDFFKPTTDSKLKELKILPGNLVLETVEAKRNVLCNQLAAVTKKLSDVILENQPSYAKELKQVQELQQSLYNAFNICKNGRRFLNSAKQQNKDTHLSLLSNHKKKRQLCILLDALRTIKTLQNTDIRLREMLQDSDYDEAVQLCLECINVASTYRQYSCIKDLTSKLQDTLEQIEEQIDVALSSTCNQFDVDLYKKLQNSYKMLGKSQAAVDQLLMHYTNSIHITAHRVVSSFTTGKNPNEQPTPDSNTSNFKELCSQVNNESYIPCLLSLCKSLWKVMLSYHKTINWHTNNQNDDEYVMKRLAHGRRRVWGDVQSRVKLFFVTSCRNLMTSLNFEQFIIVLDVIKKFIKLGEKFSSDHSALPSPLPTPTRSSTSSEQQTPTHKQQLSTCLHQQTLEYLRYQHRSCTEELVMFIENESFHPLQVKQGFNVQHMQEFKFLQQIVSNKLDSSQNGDHDNDNEEDCFIVKNDETPFDCFDELLKKLKENKTNDCDVLTDDDDVMSDDDSKIEDYVEADDFDIALKLQESSAEVTSEIKKIDPIITNCSLHVLRLCGNYMKMAEKLKEISSDVVIAMSQLFDIYFYSIFNCLTSQQGRKRSMNDRLEVTMKGIKQTLFTTRKPTENGHSSIISVNEPQINQQVYNDETTLFGVQERIVALQSLSWLAAQFESVRENLQNLMSSDNNKKQMAFLNHFFSQTVGLTSDVQWCVLFEVTSQLPCFNRCVQMMKSVNWNVGDIMTQHNEYVDVLLQQMTDLKLLLKHTVTQFAIPESVEQTIWRQCIVLSNHSFVEGFSLAKSCSNEGRALMQLDYQQFLNKLEKITNIRPTPNREHVESYIKAFYLISDQLEEWVEQSSSKYTAQQLNSLKSLQQATNFVQASPKVEDSTTKQKVFKFIDNFKKQ